MDLIKTVLTKPINMLQDVFHRRWRFSFFHTIIDREILTHEIKFFNRSSHTQTVDSWFQLRTIFSLYERHSVSWKGLIDLTSFHKFYCPYIIPLAYLTWNTEYFIVLWNSKENIKSTYIILYTFCFWIY